MPALTAGLPPCATVCLCVFLPPVMGSSLPVGNISAPKPHLITLFLRLPLVPTLLDLVLWKQTLRWCFGYIMFIKNQSMWKREGGGKIGQRKKWKCIVGPTELWLTWQGVLEQVLSIWVRTTWSGITILFIYPLLGPQVKVLWEREWPWARMLFAAEAICIIYCGW